MPNTPQRVAPRKAYSETRVGSDGLHYSVRYSLSKEEYTQLMKVGLIGKDTSEIVSRGSSCKK